MINFVVVGPIVAQRTRRFHRPVCCWSGYRRANYPTNWHTVSAVLKRVVDYRCELCQRRFPVDQLSVHHCGVPYAGTLRGDRHNKHDLRRENLLVLCQECHSREEKRIDRSELNRSLRLHWRRTNPAYYTQYGLVPVSV